MTRDSEVAARIAALCLTGSGELAPGVLPAMAVRAGLLLDLAFEGRITQTDTDVEIDVDRLGRRPADRALAELGSLDGNTLEWWLDHGRISPADLAGAELAAGSWQLTRDRRWHRAPRYAVASTTRRDRDRELLAGTLAPDAASDVAVVTIAVAAGLADGRRTPPGETLLARAGAVRWLCELVADHLTDARITGNAVGRATWTALNATRP